MKLSPNFSLAEMTVTSTGLANQTDNSDHLDNLRVTAWQMENVRRLLGRPIEPTSAYRNRTVNRVVGGVANGDHPLGYAVDFRGTYDEAKKIAESCIVFDQLILERNGTIIHLSFNPKLRRQVLTQKGPAGSAFQSGLVK